MKNLNKTITLCIFAAIFSVSASANEFKKQIEARQAYMTILSYNMGTLGAMAGNKMPYDAELASTAAQNLALAAGMNNGTMWPQGSDLDSHGDTRAKAVLWQNFPDVVQYLNNLKDSADLLANTAGNGLTALQKNIGPVGKTCKGCHDDFRKKKSQ